jgi:arginine/lysine/ornithine decarboxylase
MLERYAGENALRFHMPGHKGLTDLPGAAHDLTEIPGTDSLFDPKEGILEAQKEAARCWRAGRSYLLVNGSTAGVHAMILWAKAQGRSLFLPRDCHISAVYACALADLQPVWMEPRWNSSEQLVQQAGNGFPQMPRDGKLAVFTTYPDYYGRCIGLDEIKNKFTGYDAVLLADSAHGAHFMFSGRLPPDAGAYADMWVSGAHKTLPAPTQTAFLHLKREADATAVTRILRGVTTTSPSYLLMEGLDSGRAYMQSCRERLDELIGGCLRLADRLNAIGGLRCWREADVRAMGYAAYDPTRLVVDVRALGMPGWEAGALLRELGLQAEMCDICRVILIATVLDGRERLEGVYDAFVKLAARKRAPGFDRRMDALPARGEAAMTIRQAWFSQTAEVALDNSAGRVAAEPFGSYPPGMPLCMPGETITKDIVYAVLEAQSLGGKFFGIREGKITVVK